MNSDPLVVLDQAGKMVTANAAFAGLMKISPEAVQNMDMFNPDNGPLSRADLAAQLKAALKKESDFQIGTGSLSALEGIGLYRIVGRVIGSDDDRPHRILLRFVKDR